MWHFILKSDASIFNFLLLRPPSTLSGLDSIIFAFPSASSSSDVASFISRYSDSNWESLVWTSSSHKRMLARWSGCLSGQNVNNSIAMKSRKCLVPMALTRDAMLHLARKQKVSDDKKCTLPSGPVGAANSPWTRFQSNSCWGYNSCLTLRRFWITAGGAFARPNVSAIKFRLNSWSGKRDWYLLTRNWKISLGAFPHTT